MNRDEPISDSEIEQWEPAEVEPARQPLRAALTVRFSEDEFRKLNDAARTTGVSMGDVVRRAVRLYLEDARPTRVLVMGYSASSANILGTSGITTFGQGFPVEEEDVAASA